MTNDHSEHERRAPAAWSLLARALEPLPPPPALRQRLLERLRGSERFSPFAAAIGRSFGLTQEAVRAALARIDDPGAWQPAILPGSSFIATDALLAARTVISRLPAGTLIANHRHTGRELTYVLDGELIENGTARLGPGELLDMSPDSEHALAVAEHSECLVVFSLPIA